MEKEDFIIKERKIDENTYDIEIEKRDRDSKDSAYEKLVKAVNHFLRENNVKQATNNPKAPAATSANS